MHDSMWRWRNSMDRSRRRGGMMGGKGGGMMGRRGKAEKESAENEAFPAGDCGGNGGGESQEPPHLELIRRSMRAVGKIAGISGDSTSAAAAATTTNGGRNSMMHFGGRREMNFPLMHMHRGRMHVPMMGTTHSMDIVDVNEHPMHFRAGTEPPEVAPLRSSTPCAFFSSMCDFFRRVFGASSPAIELPSNEDTVVGSSGIGAQYPRRMMRGRAALDTMSTFDAFKNSLANGLGESITTDKEKVMMPTGDGMVARQMDDKEMEEMMEGMMGGNRMMLRVIVSLVLLPRSIRYHLLSTGALVAVDDKGVAFELAGELSPNEICVHEDCLLWSPEVHFTKGRFMNVQKELRRSGGLYCSVCGGRGAALGCRVPACRHTYHVPCARRTPGCHFDDDAYVLSCPQHPPAAVKPKKLKRKQPSPPAVRPHADDSDEEEAENAQDARRGKEDARAPPVAGKNQRRARTGAGGRGAGAGGRKASAKGAAPVAPEVPVTIDVTTKGAVKDVTMKDVTMKGVAAVKSKEEDAARVVKASAPIAKVPVTKDVTMKGVTLKDEAAVGKKTEESAARVGKECRPVERGLPSTPTATSLASPPAEGPFEVLCDSHDEPGGAARGRLHYAPIANGHPSPPPLFASITAVFLEGGFLSPSFADVASILQCGGGTVIPSSALHSPTAKTLLAAFSNTNTTNSTTTAIEKRKGEEGEAKILLVVYADVPANTPAGSGKMRRELALVEKRREAAGLLGKEVGARACVTHNWIIDSAAAFELKPF
ncbi:unnamed protein product [Closterium sp. Yama58-4]|nr:unnamed protein product [Closterium sp. Yama58-4]